IVSCQDISEQKKIQGELEHERERYKELADDYLKLAYYDPLTGLPNRRHFFDTLNDFDKRYQTEKRDFAVIFMDLDHFKHANDVYGHKGGDELLIVAADKLRICVEKDEFVARLGGDEFMIIMPYTNIEDIHSKIKKIHDTFHQSILFNGQSYEIGISAGYSVFSKIGNTTQLMQEADEAMYSNKKRNI
ncbi:MAG: GGDEF domain-containing protein, partial [Ruthenibacterium sp.]